MDHQLPLRASLWAGGEASCLQWMFSNKLSIISCTNEMKTAILLFFTSCMHTDSALDWGVRERSLQI